VECETGSHSETCVTCNVNGKEEICIKVEEAINIKDEIPEAITFSPIKTEHEVRLWGVFEVVAVNAFRPFIDTIKEIVKLHLTISCFVLYCGCHMPFEIWIAILKRRYCLEVIAIG